MTTETPTTSLKTHIDAMRRDLEAMVGENRLQRHLLRMELHDRLQAFEHRHAELQAAVSKARKETVESLRASIAELRRTFDEIRNEPTVAPPSMGTPAASARAVEPVEPDHAPSDAEC